MEHPVGELDDGSLRVDFDRRPKLEFHGSRITTDGGSSWSIENGMTCSASLILRVQCCLSAAVARTPATC